MPTPEERIGALEQRISVIEREWLLFKRQVEERHTQYLRDISDMHHYLTMQFGMLSGQEHDIRIIQRDIAALKERADSMEQRLDRLETTTTKHTTILDQHTAILDQHTAILDQHTAILNQHTAILNQHTALLTQILERLPEKPQQS
jgi:chromosome segregation ATPase